MVFTCEAISPPRSRLLVDRAVAIHELPKAAPDLFVLISRPLAVVVNNAV